MLRRASIRRALGPFVFGAAAFLSACVTTEAVAPVVRPAVAPGENFTLHYYRTDGDYKGWGAHFWESFEKFQGDKVIAKAEKSDEPILGISWESPMNATGADSFGAYWVVNANEFRNGKVNYIIHRGDRKDCPDDSAWLLARGQQVFVNAGECTGYRTAEEAIKARK